MLQFKQFKLMLRLSRPKTMCFPFFHIYTLMFSKQFTFTHIWMAVVSSVHCNADADNLISVQ